MQRAMQTVQPPTILCSAVCTTPSGLGRVCGSLRQPRISQGSGTGGSDADSDWGGDHPDGGGGSSSNEPVPSLAAGVRDAVAAREAFLTGA